MLPYFGGCARKSKIWYIFLLWKSNFVDNSTHVIYLYIYLCVNVINKYVSIKVDKRNWEGVVSKHLICFRYKKYPPSPYKPPSLIPAPLVTRSETQKYIIFTWIQPMYLYYKHYSNVKTLLFS